MIKKDDCVSSQSTLSSTDSGFSELNFNNSNNKQAKSMFDLPKINPPLAATAKPIHGSHSIVKPVQPARHELPVIGSFTRPDLYRSMKFHRRNSTNFCRNSKACPNLLEPLVTSPSSSEKLKRLSSISELSGDEEYPDGLSKHHTIPPLKRKPTKPFI